MMSAITMRSVRGFCSMVQSQLKIDFTVSPSRSPGRQGRFYGTPRGMSANPMSG